jgi:hypothetical protein
MIVTPGPTVLTRFFLSAITGPLGCTGQPRCAQRFDRIVKLGPLSVAPLFRMYAVRRETSPSTTLRKNVAITNWFSGKLVIGPRSTFFGCWLTNAGATMKPIAGTATMPPISAPRPSVEASRKTDRG